MYRLFFETDIYLRIFVSRRKQFMETLRTLLKERFEKGMNISVGRKIIDENLWEQACMLVADDDRQIAFRAAWALQWAIEHDKDRLTLLFQHILSTFLASDNGSVLRIYAKLLNDAMPRAQLDDASAHRVAEKAFDLLLDKNVKVAVKVWLMEILASLTDRIDYVAENLAECVLALSQAPDCTPAMTSHSRRILRRIRK